MITDGNKYQKPETTCIRLILWRYVQQQRSYIIAKKRLADDVYLMKLNAFHI